MRFGKSRWEKQAPFIAAFVGAGVVALGAVGYFVQRWLRAQPQDDETELTDFSDPYIPAPARRGSRRAVHSMV